MGGRVRGWGSVWGGGGQVGWERRIEAFVNFFFFIYLGGGEGASGWGVRVDVNGEIKFL